ncbi:MAG: extracellular solute-binding protein [Lachnospiraceae bacterium]
MWKMKKITGLILAAAMSIGLLAGCGSSGGDGQSTMKPNESVQENGGIASDGGITKYPRNEKGYPDLQGETITIWHAMITTNTQATGDLGEYQVIKDLEEKFNCNLEFIHPPVGQERDNFTIMMADTQLPDMIFCSGIDQYYPGGVNAAYEDGILYDYTQLINEENTPNFWNLIQNDDFMKKAVTDDQNRIIRLGAKICGSEEADLSYIGPLVRKDYLDAAEKDVPQTIDDWTALLKAMKENGIEYPLAIPSSNNAGNLFSTNVFSSAYGIAAGDYYLKDDGSVAYGPYEEAYKDYLTLLNQWYKAGYINPDFPTQNEDTIMSLASDDKVGSTVMHLYTYGVTYYVTVEGDNPDKILVPAPIPVLKEGDELAPIRKSYRSLGDYKYITADAKNPEACVALLDALYLEDIDRMLANGVEGVAYDMVDGMPVVKTIPTDATKEELLSLTPHQWHTREDTDLDYILTKKYNKGSQDEALLMWKEQGTQNSISNFVQFTTEESGVMQSYETDIETYVEEMFLKFVMGQEPLENFETYRGNLKSMHIEDMIAVYQAAVDRVEAR